MNIKGPHFAEPDIDPGEWFEECESLDNEFKEMDKCLGELMLKPCDDIGVPEYEWH